MDRRSWQLVAPLLVLGAASLDAQPVRTLARPAIEYEEPFSGITGIRELKDGRVIVADRIDKILAAIDLRTGRTTAIGREGSGPNEWGLAIRVIPYGDTTLVADPLNSRFLVIGPDGRAVRTFSPVADQAIANMGGGQRGAAATPPAGAAGGGAAVGGGRGAGQVMNLGGMSMISARAVDRMGRLYTTGSPIEMTDAGPKGADSIPIIRQDLKSNRADTMAWVHQPKNSAEVRTSSSGGNQTMSVRIGSNTPFVSADDWAVYPDGRIVIARAVDYRVDVVMPDKRIVRGAPVRYTPVRVTEADKAQWRENQRTQRPIAISSNDGARAVATAQMAAPSEPASWPEVKSPFVLGSVFASPSGETWVVRQRAANDHVPSVDVFDVQGKLAGTVKLPVRTRVIGFGAKGVYLVRSDEDDLQYLQLHSMTWTGCPPELRENCATR